MQTTMEYAEEDLGLRPSMYDWAPLRRGSTLVRGSIAVLVLAASLAGENVRSEAGRALPPPDGANLKPASRQAGIHFSEEATDDEISRARIFDEPLLPLPWQPIPRENRALATALASYAERLEPDDFSGFDSFLRSFPQSRWRASLLLHLGTEYYNSGHYSRALTAWEQAWSSFKEVKSGPAKAQADRALGELARMYCNVGRTRDVEELLEATKDRPLEGPGTQLIEAARQVLWIMQNRPEMWFKCGPLALDRILTRIAPAKAGNPLITACAGTTNGFSLAQVADLSRQLGMNYQMAFRSPGAPVIVPAVVHWKAGHYAALVQREGDRFLAQDPTFRVSPWMTRAAVDDEASGYFLVPAGPLPAGWRSVDAAEAQLVWGKGPPNGQNPNALTPQDLKCGGNCWGTTPMTAYQMHIMLASLNLNDNPVGYTPPFGPPVRFILTYNQREANQPATFYYSNLGSKWTCNWIAYINDNPTSPTADVYFYVDGGGTFTFSGFDSSTQTYTIERTSHALLIKTSGASYEMDLPDGSKKLFAASDGSVGTSRRVFLTQIVDSAGNSLRLNYDTLLRITSVIDAIGQTTTLQYTNAAYPFAVTSVTDPFGRSAQFAYNASGKLVQITDVIGISSQFTYGTNDFISALTTPYGTTTFSTGITNGITWLQATDPLGASELLEINQNTPIAISDPLAVVPHRIGALDNYLVYRNSLFWDKKAFLEGPADATKATIYHFLHETSGAESPILESVKAPLENRVWYTYQGQSSGIYAGSSASPSFVGRVLDDGTSQVYGYQYNTLGNVTSATDPLGRNFSQIYASNNLDLLEVHMTHNGKNELLAAANYNSHHLPLTITDAAGQSWTNTYNTNGQLLSLTNPKGEVTTAGYDSNGYLVTITGRLQSSNDVIYLTYDGFGRVRTVTDLGGYTLAFDYDNLDRRVRTTYPDGTFEQAVYDRLDIAASCDRLGRWSTNTYDADRRPVQVRDPLGRITTFEWCQCGSLTALIDPLGRTTTWRYDLQSRPTARLFMNGSTIAYTYESTTSRLKSRRDEKGQDTLYEYYPDDQLKRVSYPNALIPTPTVTFTYDPDYLRVLTMHDGVGTTSWNYWPVGVPGALQVASADGPWPNDTITYQYDSLDRVTNCAINGAARSYAYDTLGRITNIVNALGSFNYTYDNATWHVLDEVLPNGQTTHNDYFDNLGDQRLQSILHRHPGGAVISHFTYEYSPVGNVTNLVQELGGLTNHWVLGDDAADQLGNVRIDQGLTNTSYVYSFDMAGNRLSETINATSRTFQYNPLNELTSDSDAALSMATFEWDAENRMTAVNLGLNRSEFYYDGIGRLLRTVERTNGVAQSEMRYVWCGSKLCEARDATAIVVQKRYFEQGTFVASGPSAGPYLYTRDHLGSVRELLDGTGTVRARYDYQPYGWRVKLAGDLDADWGFTGFLVHSPTALNLAIFRVYDASLGRWLSRDPLLEDGGANLYAYAANNPASNIDPLGLYYRNLSDPKEHLGDNQLSTKQILQAVLEKDDSQQTLTYAGHGVESEPGIVVWGQALTPEQFFVRFVFPDLKAHPEVTRVRLDSCFAGASLNGQAPLAQTLAFLTRHYLHRNIVFEAPNNKFWPSSDGNWVVGPADPKNPMKPLASQAKHEMTRF